MKKKSIWVQLLIIINLLISLSFQKIIAQENLKVMSYNIHRGQDSNNEDRLMDMARFIRECNVDIVGLQEVDSVCYRSGRVDQAKVLAEKTGMNYTFARHFAFQGGAYGQAILSKFPIIEVWNHRLPIKSDKPEASTAFLSATINVKNKRWLVGVVHLDYRDENSRESQAQLINSIYNNPKTPCILMGDLNDEPSSKTVSILLQNFNDTHPDDSYTFPVGLPVKKIDYILINHTENVKIKKSEVLDIDFSDHCPIVTTFKIYQK